MAKSENKAMSAGNTVQIDSHAVATLRYIRASIEGASALTVPGSAAIAVGIVGVAAAVLSSLAAFQDDWLILWLVAAVVAVVAGGALMASQASPKRLSLSGAPLRKFALCQLPALFAGAIMTAVHVQSGNLHAIPGTWLVLYGCSLISASAVTNRTIGLLGAVFVAFGLIAFALPDSFHILMLAAGFGGLHIVFGLYMRRVTHGDEA